MASVSMQAGAVTAPPHRDLWGFLRFNRAVLIYKVEKEPSRSGVLPRGGLYGTFSKIRSLLPFLTLPLFFKYNSNPHTVQ